MSLLKTLMSIFVVSGHVCCYRTAMSEPLIEKSSGWRGTREIWMLAAYEALLDNGIDAVKVMPLAERLGLSRTSFYGHFSDRGDLLEALIGLWKSKNTGNLIKRTEAYSETITEAILNVFDLWLMPDLFDSRLEFAVRNWAHSDTRLAQMLEEADQIRVDVLQAMFERFGFNPEHASVRANTVYQTQIGYISMKKDGPAEPLEPRRQRMLLYAEIFAGQPVTDAETARFFARHPLPEV